MFFRSSLPFESTLSKTSKVMHGLEMIGASDQAKNILHGLACSRPFRFRTALALKKIPSGFAYISMAVCSVTEDA